MPDLIPIHLQQVGSDTIQTVDARILHDFLQVKARFNDWITRRIETYGFLQDIDFTVLRIEYGTITTVEYHLSLDMAKELSMVEKTARGKEARRYFLDCEKAANQLPKPLAPLTFDYLRDHRTFLEDLGVFDERDRLMLADISRTQLQRQAGLLPPGQTSIAVAQGFDIEDALRTLAPHLSAGIIRKHTGQAGKAVAAEYRSRYGRAPEKTARYVDGKQRGVNWYTIEEAEWAYPILQSYLAQQGLLSTAT